MAKLSVKPGSTDVTVDVFVQDTSSTTGAGLTGLAHDTSGLTAYYARERGAATAITLATLASATASHADGGFVAVDGTNMPGLYRLDLPDAACSSGARSVVVYLKGASGMAPVLLEIDLSAQVEARGEEQTLATGGTTTVVLAVGASAADDAYNGHHLVTTGGTGADQVLRITDYVGSTRTATVATLSGGTPTAMDDDTTYQLIPQVPAGTVGDKAGYALSSSGLDSISTAAPSGVASNFREMVVQTWRRFFRKVTKDADEIVTYADNGTTVLTTQTYTSGGSDETVNAAS